ncbi:MAG TPA: N-acetyltransferase [Anaerolineales bacterium]|nr:N-acetyltransferase [Anaerolineales bacterium]HLO31590.1 N-acetyltransferase [Anaerolineales bacterium]
MEYELIALSQLDNGQIKRLSALHCSVMHTLLADLGLPVVLRYYQVAQANRDVLGFCAVSQSGELLGWAIGSSQPDMINARLRTPLLWFAAQILRLALTRPGVLWQLITSVVSSSSQADMKNGAMELTYIGVASNQRGRGLGKELLNAFIKSSQTKGYRSVVLSVEQENVPATSLYEKAGFKIIKSFSEGHYQRHRMELILA